MVSLNADIISDGATRDVRDLAQEFFDEVRGGDTPTAEIAGDRALVPIDAGRVTGEGDSQGGEELVEEANEGRGLPAYSPGVCRAGCPVRLFQHATPSSGSSRVAADWQPLQLAQHRRLTEA
ncbi:hypothetical protein KCMC57_up63840 [Kitasatospora sp. CMC57]|uniref:Uncharacterized protein n=1 Tax=Kitasatospora sp. CMC57 TaxID=3231513 RepID=A0AB33KBX5_9ACTN